MHAFPEFNGKKVLIWGLGLNDGGLGMVDFFMSQGANVTITDGKTEEQLSTTLEKLKQYEGKITYHLGGHIESDFTINDIIIRNPAIKPDNPFLQLAIKNGKRIEMEISLFLRLAPCKVLGISGTRGKSTTTTLTYLLLKEHYGDKVVLAGNIGKSAIRELPNLTEDNIVVLELSSFQLDTMRAAKQSPHYSLLTNIYEDHLNWHKDLEDYIDCKLTLFKFQQQSDLAIVNIDDKRAIKALPIIQNSGANLVTFSSSNKAARYYRNGMQITEDGKELVTLNNMLIDGEHNYQNALGAIAFARQFDVTAQEIDAVLSVFNGVDGREQLIREINGIKIFNDTTATSLEAMITAMERFGPKFQKKIIMISGGMDKGLDYSRIADYWKKSAKALVLLDGTASEKMAASMELSDVPVYKYYNNVSEAVRKAYDSATSGDMIILCPGATSFNMFANEFDRGRQFNTLVEAL
jgi:UDP-N-acetylmuramoylalanine--D-glutamate ligase